MNVIEFVHEIGKRFGRELSAGEADHILWAHTGFPCFFEKRGTYAEVLEPQVVEYFESTRHGEPCGC